MAEPPPDASWNPRTDWEALAQAEHLAAGSEPVTGPGRAAAQQSTPAPRRNEPARPGPERTDPAEAAPAANESPQPRPAGRVPAQAAAAGNEPARGRPAGYEPAHERPAGYEPAHARPAGNGAVQPGPDEPPPAEPDAPAQTVPLVPFTPFVTPHTPMPVAGLDAGQAGPAVTPASIVPGRELTGTRGMTGILGQDQLRGGALPPRFPFPRVSLGQRSRWWLWRAGSALAAGVLAATLTAWPAGLLAAGLVLATAALCSYRISPAFSPAARASSARRRTRRRLARLGSAGYLTLHRRAIPGTDQVIDHLVVGPAGIYAVDSEVWDRRLPVRATRGGKLFHGPRDQAARLEHARWEAGQVARLISQALGQPITARAAMVIYGPTVPWIVVRISGVDVFCGRRLRKYLRREASGRSGYLDDRQVEAIHEIAAQVLPPAV